MIVLHNSADSIGPCLDAVARLNYENFTTWVLDNDSSDAGADLVDEKFPSIHLVRSGTNLGFAGGNNRLAREAPEAEIILMLNPDTEIDPECLSRLADAFAADPGLGVAGCMLLAEDKKTILHMGGELRPNALSFHVAEGEQDEGQYSGFQPAHYVQGAAMAVRKALWNDLGGLDPGYFPAYFEEVDFCERARRKGWKVGVVAEARAIHHQQTENQLQSPRFLELYFRGRGRYIRRNLGLGQWLFRFAPAELRWLLSSNSKGLRRLAVRSTLRAFTGGSGDNPRSD